MPLSKQPFLSCVQCRHDEDGLKVPVSAFWMVCLTVFIDSLGGSISAPVLPFYAKAFEVSNESVGLLFSSFSIAQVIFLPICGWLADHVGRRRVLILSLFGAALGAWAQGLAPTFWLLVAGRIVSGACGAVGSTANVYVSDITSEGVRGQYLGHIMSSNAAAFAFGPGLGGGLSRFGLNVPVEVQGVLCLVAGLLAFVYLPESPAFVGQQQRAAQDSAALAPGAPQSISADIWAVCFVEFLRGISFSAIFALYGIFALEVYGLDSLHIGFVVCVGAIVFLCTNVWITCPLQRFLRQIPAASLGMVLMAFGELLLAFGPTLCFSLCGSWVVYMGQAIAGCTIAAITSTLATDSNRGEVMSMQQMAQALGRVVGPWALGYASNVDPRLPFAIAAGASLLGAGVLASLFQTYNRKLGLAPEPTPVRTPPAWFPEEYTDEDVEDLGRFLCELLTEGHYRWHEPEQRAALKKAMRICFPPLTSEEAAMADVRIFAERYGPCTPGPMRARRPSAMGGTRERSRSREPGPVAAAGLDDGPVGNYRSLKEATREEMAKTIERFNKVATPDLMADRALNLFRQLQGMNIGNLVDQATHGLQTATRAHRDSADEETVVCALLHDLGEVMSPVNHGEIAAGLLRPYVSPRNYWILAHHEIFQAYHYQHAADLPVKDSRERFRGQEHFQACADFCEHWDQPSFDPDYDTLPLEFFEPMVRRIFARSPYWP